MATAYMRFHVDPTGASGHFIVELGDGHGRVSYSGVHTIASESEPVKKLSYAFANVSGDGIVRDDEVFFAEKQNVLISSMKLPLSYPEYKVRHDYTKKMIAIWAGALDYQAVPKYIFGVESAQNCVKYGQYLLNYRQGYDGTIFFRHATPRRFVFC